MRLMDADLDELSLPPLTLESGPGCGALSRLHQEEFPLHSHVIIFRFAVDQKMNGGRMLCIHALLWATFYMYTIHGKFFFDFWL